MTEYSPIYRSPLEEQQIAFLASFIATLPTEDVVAWHSREWDTETLVRDKNNPAPRSLTEELGTAILALEKADPDKGIDIITQLAEDPANPYNRSQAVEYLDSYGKTIPIELRLRLWDQLVRDFVNPNRKNAMTYINELVWMNEEATLQPDDILRSGFTGSQIQWLRERHQQANRRREFQTFFVS